MAAGRRRRARTTVQAPSRARRAGRSLPGATQTAVAGSLAGVAVRRAAAMLAAAVVEVGSRPIAATASVCGPIPPLAPPLAARSVHLWFRAPAITLAVQERSVRRASRRACACNACTISHPSLPPSSHSHPPPRLPSPSAYPRPARALRRRTAVVLTLGNALLRPPYPPPPTTLLSSPPLSFRSSPTHPRAPSRDRIRDGRLRVETCCERVGESEKIGRAPDACRAV